jgi:hypothetical protein
MIRYILFTPGDGMKTFEDFPSVVDELYGLSGHAVLVDVDHDATELRDMLLLLLSVIELSSSRRAADSEDQSETR